MLQRRTDKRGSKKAEALNLNPRLVCRRHIHGSLRRYVVFDDQRGAIVSARAAEDAWEKALDLIKDAQRTARLDALLTTVIEAPTADALAGEITADQAALTENG